MDVNGWKRLTDETGQTNNDGRQMDETKLTDVRWTKLDDWTAMDVKQNEDGHQMEWQRTSNETKTDVEQNNN
jgi:hypothetical protein